WKEATVIEQPALFGLRHMEPPQELTIDRSAIEKQARDNFDQYKEILERVLSPCIYADLSHMLSSKGIEINTDQWVTIIYDMVAAFKSASDRNNELVESLKGLYFGRTLTFMNKTWEWSNEQTELEILAQAEAFHNRRDYLVHKLEE
ncbi:MAG: hypothetical protein KAX28_13115, partial [Candidatus Marinimicrobia bacterium]|nr:hypothetical protein [Candidatus Neomarinimicrobiota bacterium]